jgi:hypothetical protein
MDSCLTDLNNEELVELLEEQYFTLGSTGSEALGAVLWDITQGLFLEMHGLTDERMMWVMLTLSRRLAPAWDTPAVDYYKQVNAK